jgi:hypothetical protein
MWGRHYSTRGPRKIWLKLREAIPKFCPQQKKKHYFDMLEGNKVPYFLKIFPYDVLMMSNYSNSDIAGI